jgi:hypothetical protein
MVQWAWEAAPGLAALVLAWLVGAFVYFARPDRAQNRLLGSFIVLEGVYLFSITGARFVFETERGYLALIAVGVVCAGIALVPYLMFLATLDSPLARPLRSGVAQVILALYAVYAVASWYMARDLFYDELRHVDGLWSEEGLLLDTINTGLLPLLAFVYGFFVAVSAWRRSEKGSASRQRAKAYALAFGFRDACFILSISIFTILEGTYSEAAMDRASAIILPIVQLVYLPLLVYGIAKTHLFDIDLKIKWTLRRGTLVGIFVATFFVAAQLIQNYTSASFGWSGGAVAAGLLLFALQPLQKAVDRMADRAMPGVQGSSDYEAFRKLSVYRAAVESAYEVGGVSEKERSILERMRRKLDIAARDARRIEAEFA